MAFTIEARLRHLEDLEEIRSLLIAYGRTLDDRDLGAYSRLFAEEGEWHGGLGSAKSPTGIRDMLEKALGGVPSGEYKGAFHLMSNMVINIDGDTATAWSRWTWFVPDAGGAPTAARAGHYDDSLIRESGHWRFLRRQAITQLRASTP
jgi:SnoaL-like protein